MIVHWILIFLIAVIWGRFLFTMLRLFSYKLRLPLRSAPKVRSTTKILAAIFSIAFVAYLIIFRDSVSHLVELAFIMSLPFIFEEFILPLITRGRIFFDEKRMFDTRAGIDQYDLSEIFAVKISQDNLSVFTHTSSLAFLVFNRLDYSVHDWQSIQDYFYKYHGEKTRHY